MELRARVEDLDANEPVVLPAEDDERVGAGWWRRWDAVATRREWLVREGDIDGVGAAVVGNAHESIVADLSIVRHR